jgi:hypothetical protein
MLVLTWKVRTAGERVISADSVECSGGALVLSRVTNGELVPFMMIPPSGWIEATCVAER